MSFALALKRNTYPFKFAYLHNYKRSVMAFLINSVTFCYSAKYVIAHEDCVAALPSPCIFNHFKVRSRG